MRCVRATTPAIPAVLSPAWPSTSTCTSPFTQVRLWHSPIQLRPSFSSAPKGLGFLCSSFVSDVLTQTPIWPLLTHFIGLPVSASTCEALIHGSFFILHANCPRRISACLNSIDHAYPPLDTCIISMQPITRSRHHLIV